jgi:phosphoribosylaminoimidazole-succinocarboxamide synthase
MNEPVPGKGVVLTKLSEFWLRSLAPCAPHHLDYVVSQERCPAGFSQYRDALAGRAMVVRKASVLPVECVVRGYLIGGGWREYQQSGRVSGVELPAGLRLAERLPAPIFTPSTKADSGHDEPITFEQACERVGGDWMRRARERSLAIYAAAAAHAQQRGVILADTKFEFGVADGALLLVDEVLTPDSSRFWPRAGWRPGENPASFDKQFLRDYLDKLDWPKRPPPPAIPADVLRQTAERYQEALRLLTT